MNHDQFIDSIMRSAGLTKANVNRFYAGLAELARKELVRNRHFVLPGLGSLRVKVRKARTGRNPRTGELMHIAPRRVVRFHAFGNLRAMINPPEEPGGAPEPHEEAIPAEQDHSSSSVS
jgi:integration host factor subunit alpha